MYLLAPFILQNFKKILRADPELWGCAIFGPKMAHLSWTKFFWYKPLLLLSSAYWPFLLSRTSKNSYSRPRVMRMHHFWAQNDPFTPNKTFFWNIISIIPIYLLSPFIVQNFEKILPADPELLGFPIFLSQNENFFSENLLMILLSIIHAYLHAKNQSQILIY